MKWFTATTKGAIDGTVLEVVNGSAFLGQHTSLRRRRWTAKGMKMSVSAKPILKEGLHYYWALNMNCF